LDRIEFFNAKYTGSPDEYATTLQKLLDNFQYVERKDELLVAKFISTAPERYSTELRLRRPKDISECIKIVNAISQDKPLSCSATSGKKWPEYRGPERQNTECYRCGSKKHKADFPNCPAKRSTCRNCSKMGHFATVCKQAKHQQSAAVVIANINNMPRSILRRTERPMADIMIQRESGSTATMKMLIDTGSEVSILPQDFAKRYFSGEIKQVSNIRCSNFDSSPISIKGWLQNLVIKFKGRTAKIDFLISEANNAILGMDAIIALRIAITPEIAAINNDEMEKNFSTDKLISMSNQEVSIQLKEDAPHSIIQKVRRLPFNLEAPVAEEIRKLIAQDVIEPIESSAFVSPIVIANKKNGIRLCVDYRKINQHIKIDQFPIPTQEEIHNKLYGAQIFSKVDLTSAYHQLPIRKEDRDLTAFITHIGLFRYKRLPFGLANAPAAFMRVMTNILRHCEGIVCYLDDILVYGKNMEEHDQRLNETLLRLKSNRVTINEEKSLYRKEEIVFLGRLINKTGVHPVPEALKAIIDLESPKTKQQLRSFLGMAGYYRSNIPGFAELSHELYKMTRTEITFQWTEEMEAIFQKLKQAISEAVPLAFYSTDMKTETILTTDASDNGFGAVLSQIQEGIEKPIYFISRTIHDSERKYSASEKEALSVIWSIMRLHRFLYGRKFQVRTDHQSLRQLLTAINGDGTAPCRISRWATKLLPYNFTVSYIKGKTNVVADGLSRLSGKNEYEERFEENVEVAIITNMNAITIQEIEEETKKDDELSKLAVFLDNPNGTDNNKLWTPFRKLLHEFSKTNEVILRGDRIVVPTSLQEKIMKIANEGHQGMVKTKIRLRTSYWWPGMDKHIEDTISKCACCRSIPRESPVQESIWPIEPWFHLALDIAGPKYDMSERKYYILNLIDYHSKFTEIKITTEVSTETIIEFLEETFSRFGYCTIMTTDNGPQFISDDFKRFLQQCGITQRRSSIYNPQANGTVERMNRNVMKALTAESVPKDLSEARKRIREYLLNYHATKHGTTEKTPAELMFGRKINTRLEIRRRDEPTEEKIELQKVVQKKIQERIKYANNRRKPQFTNQFKVGDLVQTHGGPIRRLEKQIGPHTFLTDNKFTINTRKLRLVKKPEPEKEKVDNRTTEHHQKDNEKIMENGTDGKRKRKPPNYLGDYIS